MTINVYEYDFCYESKGWRKITIKKGYIPVHAPEGQVKVVVWDRGNGIITRVWDHSLTDISDHIVAWFYVDKDKFDLFCKTARQHKKLEDL